LHRHTPADGVRIKRERESLRDRIRIGDNPLSCF
jgi:hypothetical protein